MSRCAEPSGARSTTIERKEIMLTYQKEEDALGIPHNAFITHACVLEEHPSEVRCACACGYSWTRNWK
jgi:hypothetical protein